MVAASIEDLKELYEELIKERDRLEDYPDRNTIQIKIP